MTAPVAHLSGAPRDGAGSAAGHAASPSHWSAAMDHAERGGDAPAADAGDASGQAGTGTFLKPLRRHAEKDGRHEGATNDKSETTGPDAGEPGGSTPKARGHGGARPHTAARAAHSAQTGTLTGFAGLIFESSPVFSTHPSSAAAPPGGTNAGSVSSSDPLSEPASPLTESKDLAGQKDAVTRGHTAPPAAGSSAGTANADSQDPGPAAGAGVQEVLPSSPAMPASAAAAATAPPSNNAGGAHPIPTPGETATDRSDHAASSGAGQVQAVQDLASQISLQAQHSGGAMLASPPTGMVSVPPAQAAATAGAISAAPSGTALVAATPSALAAAVLAMQKAGDTSTILSLDPAGLGAMTVHVSVGQASQVNVQFVPSLSQTAHLLTSSLDDLRQAMIAAGITLGQTSVTSDGGNGGGDRGGRTSQAGRPEAGGRLTPPAPATSHTGPAEIRRGGISAYA